MLIHIYIYIFVSDNLFFKFYDYLIPAKWFDIDTNFFRLLICESLCLFTARMSNSVFVVDVYWKKCFHTINLISRHTTSILKSSAVAPGLHFVVAAAPFFLISSGSGSAATFFVMQRQRQRRFFSKQRCPPLGKRELYIQ